MLSETVHYLQFMAIALIALSVPAQALWEKIFCIEHSEIES
jgi:hypothetical protein